MKKAVYGLFWFTSMKKNPLQPFLVHQHEKKPSAAFLVSPA
jgi:hypothetical protein